jgi:hypothetical protein
MSLTVSGRCWHKILYNDNNDAKVAVLAGWQVG